MTYTGTLLKLYARVASDVMRPLFTKARCVNGTRICIDVLRAFDVEAEPLSVHVVFRNAVLEEAFSRLGRMPTREECPEGWAVMLNNGHEPVEKEAWDGHLVAIVQGRGGAARLVDSAAMNLSRPAKRMTLPDVFAERVADLSAAEYSWKNDEGAVLSYLPRPGDTSYQALPGFQPTEHNREVTREIVRQIREALDGRTREVTL